MKVVESIRDCPGEAGARTPPGTARRHALLAVYGSETSVSARSAPTESHSSSRDATETRHPVTLLCLDGEVTSLGWSSARLQPCGKAGSAAHAADSSDGRETRRAQAVAPTTAAPTIANTCRHVSEGIPMVLTPSTR
jgi:hypothetical protein